MTKVIVLNDDGSFQEVDINISGGSVVEINCGTSITEPNPTTIDCGGAAA